MSDINEIVNRLVTFRDERDWKQFHNSKDLAIAISVEAAELLQLFLWKQSDQVDKNKLKDELADVLAFSFLLAEREGFDIRQIILDKIAQNADKYPIEKAKGTAKKYNEL
jgi:NTP pyrophosphatase (non-canonical NTP hydrolase)